MNDEVIAVKDVDSLKSNLPQELKTLPKEILYPQLVKQLIVDHTLMIAIKKDGIEKQPLIQKNIEASIKELHLRQIIVQTPEIAQIVLKKLKEGQSFSKLAGIYSIDLQNRQTKQGDIGWFKMNDLNSSIINAISSFKNDEYTHLPIETNYGWVLFQKIDDRTRPIPTLDSVKETIKEQITKEAITNLYEESLKKVHIIEY